MRKKLLLWLFSLLLIVGFASADWYYNPATGKIDYYEPAGKGPATGDWLPATNDAFNLGNNEYAWQDIVITSTGAFYYGDTNVDNTWKTIRDGTKLSFQRRETGSYVEKGWFDTSFHSVRICTDVLDECTAGYGVTVDGLLIKDGAMFGSLVDANGNEILIPVGIDTAFNEFTITNAVSGNGPILSATGGNANIDINITPKGASSVVIKSSISGIVGSHSAGQLIIQNPGDTVFGNVVITAYESDGAGNPDQQLWYLGSSSGSNTDITFLNRRNANLHLGTNNLTRMIISAAGDIYTVAWADYGGTSTVVGFSGTPTVNIWYKKIGNLVYVNFYISGTSNDTPFTFTLPYTNVNDTNSRVNTAIKFKDNNTQSTVSGQMYLAPNTDIVALYTDWAAQIWTPANTKEAMGQFWFEAQ